MLRNVQEICKVMEGLARNERAIAELYSACADQWPEDRKFWQALADAEGKHAAMIESLSEILTRRPERFEAGRPFNLTAVSSSIAWIQSNRDKVRNGSLTRGKILILARDLEQSVLEAKFAEIVKGDDLEYATLVNEVVADTQAHREMLDRRIHRSAVR